MKFESLKGFTEKAESRVEGVFKIFRQLAVVAALEAVRQKTGNQGVLLIEVPLFLMSFAVVALYMTRFMFFPRSKDVNIARINTYSFWIGTSLLLIVHLMLLLVIANAFVVFVNLVASGAP